MAEAKDSTKLKKGLIIKIDLVLFGPRSSGDSVAVDLGSRRYYLQEPHQQLCPYPYENPQSLKLPSTLTFDALETSLDVERQLSYGLEQDEDEELIAQAMPDGSSTQLNELIQNIDSFLELLPAKPITASAGSDSRIISKLFRYFFGPTRPCCNKLVLTLPISAIKTKQWAGYCKGRSIHPVRMTRSYGK